MKGRFLQTSMKMSPTELITHMKRVGPEVLKEEYYAAGGEQVHIYYDPAVTYEKILEMVEVMRPRFLVVDIADHVGFRGSHKLEGVGALEELYRRFRQLAAYYECDVITVGQASNDADGAKYVKLSNMKGSTTAKQGALDWALSIGKTFAVGDAGVRWLNVVKNKNGCTVDEINLVGFDVERGRYYDL